MTEVPARTPSDAACLRPRREPRQAGASSRLLAVWRGLYIPLQLAAIALTGSAFAAAPEAALEEARRLARQYHYDDALTALRDCPRAGASPEALAQIDLAMGRYLHALDRTDEARSALQRVSAEAAARADIRAESLALLASILQAEGDSEAALHSMRELPWEELCPDSVVSLGRLLSSLGENAKTRAGEVVPAAYMAFPLAVTSAGEQRWGDVAAAITPLLEDPDLAVSALAAATTFLAWALEGQAQSRDAERLYGAATAMSDGFAWLDERVGHFELKQGRTDEALVAFERAVGTAAMRGERLREVHLDIGKLHEGAGRTDDAIQHYRWASDGIPPSTPPAYQSLRRLGLLLLRTGDKGQAEQTFLRLLEGVTEPNQVWGAIDGLSQVYGREGEGKLQAAVEEYLTENPTAPGRREANLWIGYLADEQGDAETAISAAREVLADEETDIERKARAQLRIAYAHWHARQLDEAEAAFQTALEQYPQSARQSAIAKGDLGYVLAAGRSRFGEGIQLTREALEALPADDPAAITFQYRLGLFEEKRGNWEAALREYELVPTGRASDPHLNLEAQLPLGKARSLAQLGKPSQAAGILRTLIESSPPDSFQAQQAQAQLLDLGSAGEAVGEVRLLPPRVRETVPETLRMNARPGASAAGALVVYGNLTFAVTDANATLDFVRASVHQKPRQGFRTVHVVELTAEPDKVGKYEGSVRLATNDGEHPAIEIPIGVEVTSRVGVCPASIFFGLVEPGETKTVTITLVSALPFRTVPAVVASPQILTVEVTEADGRTCLVTASLQAPQEPGVIDGTVQLAVHVPGLQRVTIPYYAHVTGTE